MSSPPRRRTSRRYIADPLDEAALQTAEESARRASISASTVVRFSQALGFDGFPELQQAARDEYRRRPPAKKLAAAAPPFALDRTEFETALAADHANVEDTACRLSRSDVEAAIDAIVSTEKVLIAGADQMALFASYLRHLLTLLDVRAEIVARSSQEALGRLGRIDERTLVIGLSAGRPQPLIIRTMKLARDQRCDVGDRRRDAVRGRAAGTRPSVLLVQHAGVRPFAHRSAIADPGVGVRRARARRAAAQRPDRGVSAEIAARWRSSITTTRQRRARPPYRPARRPQHPPRRRHQRQRQRQRPQRNRGPPNSHRSGSRNGANPSAAW